MLTDTSLYHFNESIVAWLSESRSLNRSAIAFSDYLTEENNFTQKSNSFSLYLHFPFCEKLCSYCDLNIAVTRDQKLRNEYINAIIEEIKTRIPEGKTLDALYLGGGTPSNLSHLNFEQLFTFIFKYFDKNQNLEICIEAHPQDFAAELFEEKTQLFKKWGITEIKLGIEDSTPSILENLNRSQGNQNIFELIKKLKEKHFLVSGTFLVGLPGQTVEHLENFHLDILNSNLDYFSIRPLRLSNFNTQNMHLFGNGTTLAKDKVLKSLFSIHQKLKSDSTLKALGFGLYSRIEKKFIRTELGFMPETFQNFLGFGVGSITSLGKIFQKQNPLHLNQYISFALSNKENLIELYKRDVRAYQLNPQEINALKKREEFVRTQLIHEVVHEVGRLEDTLRIKITEANKLNYDGIFFLEALVKEIN